MKLTARYHFAAAHRLDSPQLSPEENARLYGKCNNPHGHGHDYVLDVTVEGEPDATGQLVRRAALNQVIETVVLSRLNHRNLNTDVAEFRGSVPTTENLATVVRGMLEPALDRLHPARLARIQISETGRNTFAWQRE